MIVQKTFPDAPPDTPEERIYNYPRYYEISYDEVYPAELQFYNTLIRRATGGGTGKALELAAGSGRVTRPLAGLGHDMTALDRDPTMLEALAARARRDGLSVQTVLQDMATFDLGEGVFDAILCPLGLTAVLWQRDVTVAHLRCVARALRPGGIGIFPGPAATYLDKVIPHDALWETQKDGVRARTHFFYDQRPGEEAGVVDYTHEITILDEGKYHLLVERGVLRVYSPDYIRFISEKIPVLTLAAWYDFFDPNTPLPSPNDAHGTAIHIFRRK